MKKIRFYIEKAYKTFNTLEMRVLPGNIAFFFVLASVPIITLIALLASCFSISVDTIISFIKNLVPGEASNIIIEAISGKGFDGSIGTFNIIALFIASNGMYALINAANTLYHVKTRDAIKDRVKAIVLLFILLLLIIFLLLVPMFGEKLLSLLGNNNLIKEIKFIYNILKWPTTIFLIYINLKLIYTIAPDIKIKSKSTTYGAAFTTIIWTIATAVFSYYLKYFANYNVVYGNLSNLIILMMWLYIISYVFVMGIAINVTNLEEN